MNSFTNDENRPSRPGWERDPEVLVRALEASERFRRDTSLGAIFHRGKISFRQVAARDSLHITIEGDRVSSHIDRVSPLNCDPEGRSHYALRRIAAHNVTGIVEDVVGWVRGPRRFRRRRRDGQVELVPHVLLAVLPEVDLTAPGPDEDGATPPAE